MGILTKNGLNNKVEAMILCTDRHLRIWSLKKSLMENDIFCAVTILALKYEMLGIFLLLYRNFLACFPVYRPILGLYWIPKVVDLYVSQIKERDTYMRVVHWIYLHYAIFLMKKSISCKSE